MTDIAQIALEFCRECLGWEKPYSGYQNSPATPFVCGGVGQRLWYADLNAVMEVVRGWCDKQKYWVELHSYWDKGWMAEVGPSGEGDGEYAVSPDPCYALLSACVEASRKLRAG